MNTKKNQHYQKTHQAIQDAFLSLLAKKDFSKISVREICKVAQINPSTFYAHYETVTFLLNEIAEISRQEHVKRMIEAGVNQAFFFNEQGIKVLLEYFRDYQRYYQSFYFNITDASDFNEMFNLLWGYHEEYHVWPSDAEKERFRFAFNFFAGGFIEIVKLWLAGGCRESVEDITKILLEFMPKELYTI